MIAYIPLLAAIIGALVYFAAGTNVKLAEMGRLVFLCGFFFWLWGLTGHTVKVP